jgi:hypothetical protein
VRLLLSIDRRQSGEEAMETARLAVALREEGVAGVDLSGNPSLGQARRGLLSKRLQAPARPPARLPACLCICAAAAIRLKALMAGPDGSTPDHTGFAATEWLSVMLACCMGLCSGPAGCQPWSMHGRMA